MRGHWRKKHTPKTSLKQLSNNNVGKWRGEAEGKQPIGLYSPVIIKKMHRAT